MFRFASAALILALLTACANAPTVDRRGIGASKQLNHVRDQPYAKVDQYVEPQSILSAKSASLPRLAFAAGAAGPKVSPEQAALVANRAAREVCNRLAAYLRLVETDGDLEIELLLQSVQPTSRGAAGVSEVLGLFVPGPFRLPAGLDGLAIDGTARRSGNDILLMHWAEGAGAVTENARISRIGDAYQLAGEFAKDFARALIDPKGKNGASRSRLDEAQRKTNRRLCARHFGEANIAGRGASLLLPLAPEAIDPGKPKPPTSEAESESETETEPPRTPRDGSDSATGAAIGP